MNNELHLRVLAVEVTCLVASLAMLARDTPAGTCLLLRVYDQCLSIFMGLLA